MRMRSIVSLFVLCSALATAAHVRADEKSHRAAVLELCTVMNLEKLMQESMQRMIDLQMQQMPAMKSARGQLEQFFAKYLSWKALQEDFIKLYMDAFNEAELRELVAFYKTPTGQKAVRQMPALMQRGAEIGASRVREHMSELMQMMSAAMPAQDQAKPAAQPGPKPAKPAQSSPIH
jgi:hypothetical protein